MNDRIAFCILLCLLNNGSVSNLVSNRLSYGQVYHIIRQLEEQLYIQRNEYGYWNLLDKGKEFTQRYIKTNRLKGLYKYLSIDISVLTETKLDIETPYTPLAAF
jgi:predicted methyltransferase